MMETMGKPDKDLNEVVKHICDVMQKRIDEAYQRGLDVKQRAEGAYQKGLIDAWEIAKKIAIWDFDGGYSCKELRDIFGTDKPSKIYTDNTPVEAIAKLKAYEEQKINGKIKIGDEVESLYDHRTVIENTIPWVVTKIREGYNDKKSYYGIDAEGTLRNNDLVRKTGRHFGIDKILEEMKQK